MSIRKDVKTSGAARYEQSRYDELQRVVESLYKPVGRKGRGVSRNTT